MYSILRDLELVLANLKSSEQPFQTLSKRIFFSNFYFAQLLKHTLSTIQRAWQYRKKTLNQVEKDGLAQSLFFECRLEALQQRMIVTLNSIGSLQDRI